MRQKEKKEANLGEDRIGGLLFKLALPAILAQVINLLYNLVDRMYIGHIAEVGSVALTGLGVTMPFIMCVSAFAALVSMGGAPRASIMMGRGNKEEAERILGNCTSMLVLVAVIVTVRCVILYWIRFLSLDYIWVCAERHLQRFFRREFPVCGSCGFYWEKKQHLGFEKGI